MHEAYKRAETGVFLPHDVVLEDEVFDEAEGTGRPFDLP